MNKREIKEMMNKPYVYKEETVLEKVTVSLCFIVFVAIICLM